MKKPIIQNHHPLTEKDYERLKVTTLPVTKGEHAILSRIQWYCRGKASKGFIRCLKIFIALHEHRAIDLEEKNG